MINVIGLGNFLKGDDAIGPKVIERLRKSFKESELNCIDAGADVILVLDYLLGKDPVIIVDCAKMGKTPGEVVQFDINMATVKQVCNTFSVHGFSFSEIYKMASILGPVAPCKIIGIEPKQINFNEDLSVEVAASIPKIINIVKLETQNYV